MITWNFFINFALGFLAAICMLVLGIEWKHGLGIWMAIHTLLTIAQNKSRNEKVKTIISNNIATAAGFTLYANIL